MDARSVLHVMEDNQIGCSRGVSKASPPACNIQSTPTYTYLLEKGSCKIFIAGAPQRVTHCNYGYLFYRQRMRAPMLDLEAKLFSELFPDFQSFILRRFTQYRFHATAASKG